MASREILTDMSFQYTLIHMAQSNFQQTLSQLEDTLGEYFGKKAPALPENAKELIVKFAPYLAIISLLLTLPAIFLLLGLGGLASVLTPFGGVQSMATIPNMWLSIILLIPVVVLEGLAIPGLFSKSKTAWNYMFWAQLISAVSSIVQFNLIGAVIGAVIGLYLLFQVKSYYK